MKDAMSSATESKNYMCAFVRMVDGCVVRVETGEICGEQWNTASDWINQDGSSVNDLDTTQINFFDDYFSGFKDASSSSSPKILKYLSEGTTFDNLLACDPITVRSKKYYKNCLNYFIEIMI